MATNWSFILAASAIGSSTTAGVTSGTVTPQLGDLLVVSARNRRATTASGGMNITDSSIGGATWTPMTGATATTTFLVAWWKIANAADVNGGSGITVTATQSAGTGTTVNEIECDVFRVPPGFEVVGIDAQGTQGTLAAVATLATTATTKPSSNPANTDALAWTALSMVPATAAGNGGLTGTNTFTGTSSPANLASCVTTANQLLANQFVGGVQGSATAGSNVWVNTWTTPRTGAAIIGATFVYAPSSQSGLLPILNSV